MCMNDVEIYIAQQQYKSWVQATFTVAVKDPETWLMGASPPPPPRLSALQPWYVVACCHDYDLGNKTKLRQHCSMTHGVAHVESY